MIVAPSPVSLAVIARDFAVVLAYEAMQMLRDGMGIAAGQVHIKDAGDVSSELDRKIESFLKERLFERFPDHAFLGEESGGKWPVEHAVWIVDPIDGSMNFVHRYPQYSISIALVLGGQPIAACVADPNRNEVFAAAKGQGTQLNGQSVKVADTAALIDALATTVFPKPKAVFMDQYLDQLGSVMRQVAGVRRSGSMALEMAYLAAGRCDLFWERAMGPWDAAAGVLLIEEAGGVVFTLDGQPVLSSEQIAAAVPRLAKGWREILVK